MKYDDEELAQAALVVGLVEAEEERGASMPAALEDKILQSAFALASERRYSTTNAAAISLDAPPEVVQASSSPLYAWAGWFAAAACFAFAVYEWRVSTTRPSPAAASSSVATPLRPAPLLTALASDGRPVAELRTGSDLGTGEVLVVQLPANAVGEHYRVWLSATDRASAAPAGSFSCVSQCRDAVFSLSSADIARARRLWITRGSSSEAWTLESAVVVAENAR